MDFLAKIAYLQTVTVVNSDGDWMASCGVGGALVTFRCLIQDIPRSSERFMKSELLLLYLTDDVSWAKMMLLWIQRFILFLESDDTFGANETLNHQLVHDYAVKWSSLILMWIQVIVLCICLLGKETHSRDQYTWPSLRVCAYGARLA